MVSGVELIKLHQDYDQPMQIFLAETKAKATPRQSDLTYNNEVEFIEKMVLY